MSLDTNEATSPALGDESATPEGESQPVESEASEVVTDDAADTTESAEDDTKTDSKDAESEVERVRRKMQRRIDRLTARERAAIERAARAEAAAEERRKAVEQDDDDSPKREPQQDPREIAQTMRLVEKTAEATAKVMKEAKAKFPDFEQAIAELVDEIGPQIDQIGRPSPLMDAVLDSDQAAAVLHYLGKNPEIAADLVGLSPARLGRRIERIESELKAKAAPPKPSAAAKPLAPVRPSPPPVVDPSKMTDAQWIEWRRKQRMSA